jgi:aerobic carbon-monoxide dehydrogenase medium subunit
MMPDGYAAPSGLDEAVSLLAGNPGAHVLAGGHTLLVEPNRSRIAGSLLVDLRRIQALVGIEPHPDGSVTIGAMTTLAAIAESDVIGRTHRSLAEAAHAAADAQTRNRATLGGALAGADPEADLPALVLALDATVHVVGSTGSRTIPADTLFTGAYRTALRSDAVITGVMFPALPPGSGTAYEKFRHPATLGAICGVAAAVTLGQNRSIAVARIAVTGVAEHAVRLYAVEKALANQPADSALGGAFVSAGEGITFRGDHFASADYRRHLTGVLAEIAVKRALERAAAST